MRKNLVLAALALAFAIPSAASAGEAAKSDKDKLAPPPAAEHSYGAAAKRDPFKNETEVVLPPKDPTCGGLCEFDVEQLKVAAVVTGLSVPLAGLEAPNGKVYIVDKGTKVGKRGGRVLEVSAGKIVIEEPCAKESSKKCKTELAVAKDAKPGVDEDLTRKK